MSGFFQDFREGGCVGDVFGQKKRGRGEVDHPIPKLLWVFDIYTQERYAPYLQPHLDQWWRWFGYGGGGDGRDLGKVVEVMGEI